MAISVFFFVLLLFRASSEELATPASLLGPRNFNHHSYEVEQFLKSIEPTKQGPVLFPNDAPPPPRPPLIVTSRPLIESLARSELNPSPLNNTVAQQSQVNGVSYKPEYLARSKHYKPFAYIGKDYSLNNGQVYNDGKNENSRSDYESGQPDYTNHHNNNDLSNDGRNSDYNHGSNYAFSYKVKDQKTGDDFSHSQHSTGSATNGEYRVRLPDGRTQIVSYIADENGYQADVRYDDDDKTGNSIDNHYNHNNYNNNHNNYNSDHNAYTNNHIRDNQVNHDNQDSNHNNYRVNHNDYDNDNIYAKPGPSPAIKDDYYNQYDTSKEYNDYSQEFGKDYGYSPHKSKFSSFSEPQTNLGVISPNLNRNVAVTSTVKPSYEELEPLFVTRKPYTASNDYSKIPAEINVSSSTPNSNYDFTTEHVVVIGTNRPNVYNNIRNSALPITITPNYPASNIFVSTTPSSYLASTIASLKNNLSKNVNFSGSKAVLTDSYINRINKYIKYK